MPSCRTASLTASSSSRSARSSAAVPGRTGRSARWCRPGGAVVCRRHVVRRPAPPERVPGVVCRRLRECPLTAKLVRPNSPTCVDELRCQRSRPASRRGLTTSGEATYEPLPAAVVPCGRRLTRTTRFKAPGWRRSAASLRGGRAGRVRRRSGRRPGSRSSWPAPRSCCRSPGSRRIHRRGFPAW